MTTVQNATALAGLLLLTTTGCGTALRGPAADAAAPATVPVLKRSLFAKDASGSISEDNLQTVLSSPIDLQFPARVGVVPLAQAFDSEGEVPLHTRNVAARHLAKKLVGSEHFSHVSDISTELPNVGGLEGLRAIAARYRLRYLLLYSERFEDATHLNGWAWLYPTLLGMFVAPGVTVESRGVAQVDLVDVRTGTVLYTVVEPMRVSSEQLMIGAARAHRERQGRQAERAAERLAKRVAKQTNALIAFAERWDPEQPGGRRARRRTLPAPIAADAAASAALPLAQPPAEAPAARDGS
jgi:rhombotail lipoprotein